MPTFTRRDPGRLRAEWDDVQVAKRGWRRVRLDEIPPSSAIPIPGVEEASPGREQEALRARDPAAAARFEEFARRHPDADRRSHAVRRFLDITSFGVNAFAASAGSPLVIPHDESAYGQEELYLVIRGRARFVCDGEEVELGEGELLYAEPQVRREALALETPTMLFLVGGLPGRPYEPPTWSRDWGAPE
jgi:mannose-6-phosphate isomerase-like protein (cupin superfamily)